MPFNTGLQLCQPVRSESPKSPGGAHLAPQVLCHLLQTWSALCHHCFYPACTLGKHEAWDLVCAGRKLSMPVLVAPMSAMYMAHKHGEPATARAAVAAKTSMVSNAAFASVHSVAYLVAARRVTSAGIIICWQCLVKVANMAVRCSCRGLCGHVAACC